MLRYVFLSVFALLLLIACGGNNVNQLTKTGNCVECDLSEGYLSRLDLPEANLSGATLKDANTIDNT